MLRRCADSSCDASGRRYAPCTPTWRTDGPFKNLPGSAACRDQHSRHPSKSGSDPHPWTISSSGAWGLRATHCGAGPTQFRNSLVRPATNQRAPSAPRSAASWGPPRRSSAIVQCLVDATQPLRLSPIDRYGGTRRLSSSWSCSRGGYLRGSRPAIAGFDDMDGG